MQIVGITGGIGSGKSTIARELAKRGYTVYDCDREAKRIIGSNEAVKKAIVHLLGDDAFKDGKYNTAFVARRVFAEPQLLAQLNAIVHPAVKEDILANSKQPTANSCLFVESAILYEAGLDTICDKVVVVDAPEEIRIARTIARDYQGKATEENINKVCARMHAQTRYQGDLVIINDGKTSIEELVTIITHWM